MPAPDHAKILLNTNKTWRKSKLRYKCTNCGHKDHVSELLCVEEERTLWCPKCKVADIEWEE